MSEMSDHVCVGVGDGDDLELEQRALGPVPSGRGRLGHEG